MIRDVLPGKLLILCAALAAATALAAEPDLQLRATEKGILVDTSMELGTGSFLLSLPGLVTQDIWKPLRPEVEVVNDSRLILQYPNGAKITISLSASKMTLTWATLPAEVTRIAMGFKIPREAWQGARFSFQEAPLEPFPEDDDRKNLFEGEATLFTVADPAGNGLTLAGPLLAFTLANKGPEDWSQFNCSFFYALSRHPGVAEFSLEFRPAAGAD